MQDQTITDVSCLVFKKNNINMKNILFGAVAILALVGFSVSHEGDMKTIEIGDKAPMAKKEMKAIDKQMHSLESLKEENGLLVVFSCNTCPFVVGRDGKSEGWEGRYNDLYEQSAKMGVGMVLINSNEAKRKGDDSMEAMEMHAKKQGYKMPYVEDTNHELADAFGARTTPHVFLFDGKMKLAYKGAIDDNVDSAKDVKQNYLANAMAKMIKGEKADPAATKPLGCSIKRQ